MFGTSIAYAAPPEAVVSLVQRTTSALIDPALQFLFVLAFVIFLVGMVQYIANRDVVDARKSGKNKIIYSIVGMVIIVGALSILGFMKNVIGT